MSVEPPEGYHAYEKTRRKLMSTKEKQGLEDQDLNTSQEVKTETEDQSETVSDSTEDTSEVDLSFMDEDKVESTFDVGDTKVVFKEESNSVPKDTVTPEHEGKIGGDFWHPEGDWKSTVIGEVPNGGRLQVQKREDGMGYIVNWQTGGVVPPECQGWFTSYDKAEQAARTYLNKRWEEAE